MEMELPFFEKMLKATEKVYGEIKLAESKIPQNVQLVETKE